MFEFCLYIGVGEDRAMIEPVIVEDKVNAWLCPHNENTERYLYQINL